MYDLVQPILLHSNIFRASERIACVVHYIFDCLGRNSTENPWIPSSYLLI